MEYQASKSDIDSDLDDSSDDVSIATDASSVESPLPRSSGIRRMTEKFEQAVELDDCEEDLELIRGIDGDDSESDRSSDASNGSDDDNHEMPPRYSVSSVDSDDFGPPIVVPLKTGLDQTDCGDKEAIEPGSRSSCGSRRSTRSGSFSRRALLRTKSGEGMTGSAHSNASGNFQRRPPMRTKSGEAGIAADNNSNNNDNVDGIRRRPPQRRKSVETLPGNPNQDDDSNNYAEEEEDYEGREYEGVLPAYGGDDDDDSFDANAVPASPGRRLLKKEDSNYRERALMRNSARRQRSSDTLGAMREATRNIPSRSQSDMMDGVGNLSNGRRRGPGRSQSTGVAGCEDMASPGRKPLRRRAPERTKSGGNMTPNLPLET
jgi:hypothetical protein